MIIYIFFIGKNGTSDIDMKKIIEKYQNRNSSIELLRIISMFFIIAQHYVYHGGYNNDVFLNVAPNIVYLKIISMFGYSACTIFALITGYYLINTKINTKYYYKLIPILACGLFYSVLSLAVLSIIDINSIGFRNIIEGLFPFFFGNWYFVFYILIYLFIPYINPFLHSLNSKQYKDMLKIIIVLFVVVQTIFGNVYSLNNIDFMIISYLFGAYYRLYPEQESNIKKYIYISSACFLIVILSVLLLDGMGLILNNPKFIKYDYLLSSWYCIPSFFLSLYAFKATTVLEYKSTLINIISSTVFGVYLLHDGLLKSVIWERISPNINYLNNPFIHSIIKTILVFIVCSLIDILRQITIGKYIDKYIISKENE